MTDHPGAFGHRAVAFLPFALGPEQLPALACGFGRARHRLHGDAEPGQLDEVEVEPSVVVAEQVGVDCVVEEPAPHGKEFERSVRIRHADRAVDGVVHEPAT